MELRPYQQDAARKLVDMVLSKQSALYQLPTGAGKTVIAQQLITSLLAHNLTGWFVAHRSEILDQSATRFTQSGLTVSFIQAGKLYNPDAQIQMVSIGTFASRKSLQDSKPGFIIVDEAHHSRAESYQRLPDVPIIGLTATPWRLSGAGLHKEYPIMMQGPTVKELINDRYLVQPVVYRPDIDSIDWSTCRKAMGEYVKDAVVELLTQSTIVGDAIGLYKTYLNKKRAIAFAPTVAYSEKLAADFNDAGIPAAHFDANTPSTQREEIQQKFRAGEILILCNVDLITEGYDVPDCEGVIMLRPTRSLALYLQQAGRCLRPAPNKRKGIILDMVGNCFRHGRPEDDINWVKHFYRKTKAYVTEAAYQLRNCSFCKAMIPISQKKCHICGGINFTDYAAARKIRKVQGDYIEDDGALVAAKNKRTEIYKEDLPLCKTPEDFKNLAIKLGYKPFFGFLMHKFYAELQTSKALSKSDYFAVAKRTKINLGIAYYFWESLGKSRNRHPKPPNSEIESKRRASMAQSYWARLPSESKGETI